MSTEPIDPGWARRVWRIVGCEIPLRARDVAGLVDNTFAETAPMAAVREWSRSHDPLELVFFGDVGVGKTFAAAWWITNSDGGDWRGRAVVETDLCGLASCRRLSPNRDEARRADANLAWLKSVDRLVIDNIGDGARGWRDEMWPDRVRGSEAIHEVVLARRALGLPTLLVSIDRDEAAMRRRYADKPHFDELMAVLAASRRETICGPSLRPDLGLFPG